MSTWFMNRRAFFCWKYVRANSRTSCGNNDSGSVSFFISLLMANRWVSRFCARRRSARPCTVEMCSCNSVLTSTKAKTCECGVDYGDCLTSSTDWRVDACGPFSSILMQCVKEKASRSSVSGTEFSQTVSGNQQSLPTSGSSFPPCFGSNDK